MPRIKSKKSADPEYSFISAKVISHRAAVDASINYEVLDKKRLPGTALDTKVYNFDTRLEIEGLCTSPEEDVGMAFRQIFSRILLVVSAPPHIYT